jgi:hypothetical protein
MEFAIYHAEKGKGSGSGSGNHIDRIEGKEHTFKHADPSRIKLNINFAVPHEREKMPLNKAISDRINEGYKGKKKLRSDSVKFLSHVLTGSAEQMQKIFADNIKANDWIKANLTFLKKEFGEENIVRFTLHLDEKTPHLHAVTVPLTSDGRMSAKEIMGKKKDLRARQDRYAEMMKPFNLERGIRGTGIKHENANDYYKRVEQAIETPLKEVLEPVKGFFGIDKGKTIEKHEKSLKSSNMALSELKNKLKKAEIRAKSYEPKVQRAEALAQKRAEQRSNVYEEKKNLERILDSPKAIQKYLEEHSRENDRGQNRGR